MTDHFELSIMIGTLQISGSEAMRLRKRVMQASPSSMPSSKLISMICAPFSTWERTIASAPVKSSFLISFLKRGEPVTLERSPIFTKGVSPLIILNASRPLSRWAGTAVGMARGGNGETSLTTAAICPGVVPQQPPTMLTRPALAKPATALPVCSGVSS